MSSPSAVFSGNGDSKRHSPSDLMAVKWCMGGMDDIRILWEKGDDCR
jgi:hypothetical protein